MSKGCESVAMTFIKCEEFGIYAGSEANLVEFS